VQALARYEGELSIRIVLTESACQFLNGQSDEQPTVSSLLNLPNVDAVYRDQDEWAQPWRRGASILHIE
jgi:phosphopantothenoylcysteine decarboxylase